MLGARNTEINWVQISATKIFSFIGEKDTKYKYSLLFDQDEDPSPLCVGNKKPPNIRNSFHPFVINS